MKGLTRFCLLLSLAGVLAGCQTKQEVAASITLNGASASLPTSGISAPATATEVELGFTSALGWMITSDETKAHAPWIVINPPAGVGGTFNVTIQINENPDTAPRTGYITLASGDVSKVIEVKQAGREAIGITDLTLSESAAELLPGEELTLVAMVIPSNADEDATLSWTSSDPAVATVEDGLVTAVAEGTAIITVTAGSLSKSCEITVLHVVVPVEGIALDKETLTLTEGDSGTLTASLLPENADPVTISWSSSDPGIATVEDGLVTAVYEGTATITASAAGFEATCEVTVLHRVIPVESVTLDQSAATLPVGETLTLVATVNPSNADEKTVTWTTSNGDVATVDANGAVKAIAEGTATITASCGGQSATCVITVPHVDVPVESVELDKTAEKIHVSETLQLTVTINPSNADYTSIQWTSSDPEVATVSGEGLVTAIKPGTVRITVAVGGKEAVCSVTVLPNGSTGEDLDDPIDVNPW